MVVLPEPAWPCTPTVRWGESRIVRAASRWPRFSPAACSLASTAASGARLAYNEQSEQWVPRGQVVRCHIEDDEDGETVLDIDGEQLDLAAFGRMLRVYAGWGMRIAFVDEDDVTDEPEIVVRDPDDDVANGQ